MSAVTLVSPSTLDYAHNGMKTGEYQQTMHYAAYIMIHNCRVILLKVASQSGLMNEQPDVDLKSKNSTEQRRRCSSRVSLHDLVDRYL
jgi:hypothetical protein